MKPITYYQTGIVSVESGKATVIGKNTQWQSANGVKPLAGCPFTLDRKIFYTIASVISDSELELTTPFAQQSKTDVSYAVILDREIDPGDAETDILLLIEQAREFANEAEAQAEVAQSFASAASDAATQARSWSDESREWADQSKLFSDLGSGHAQDAMGYSIEAEAQKNKALIAAAEAASQVIVAQQSAVISANEAQRARQIALDVVEKESEAEAHKVAAHHAQLLAHEYKEAAQIAAWSADESAKEAAKHAAASESALAHSQSAEHAAQVATEKAADAQASLDAINTQLSEAQQIHDTIEGWEADIRHAVGQIEVMEANAKNSAANAAESVAAVHEMQNAVESDAEQVATDRVAVFAQIDVAIAAKEAAERSAAQSSDDAVSAEQSQIAAEQAEIGSIAAQNACDAVLVAAQNEHQNMQNLTANVQIGVVDNSKNIVAMQRQILRLHGE